MTYKINLNKDTLALNLSGNVDLSETGQIKQDIQEKSSENFTKLIIEGEKISYIDSSAVALLLFLKRFCEERGATFKIIKLAEIAHKVINLAGLASLLTSKQVASQTKNSIKNNIDDSLDDLFSSE
jgi:anti-anti-sigma factor